jgi:alpha-1,6-mannosyltransferase
MHLQATHDILMHGWNLESYDHLEFPGVVPRTFLGALFLSFLALPGKLLAQALSLPKLALQLWVRAALAAAVCLAYARLLHATSRRLGNRSAWWTVVVVCCTPHFLFYASRTLPNTFAVLLVLIAFADWAYMGVYTTDVRLVERHLSASVACLVCAIAWLRCDMLVLLAPVGLAWLAYRRASMLQLVVIGAACGCVAVASTVLIDSVFWRRWLWPEGEVLWFNVVKNRSHEYGVSPWHWYFTSALPRALLGTLLLVPLGLLRLQPRAQVRRPNRPNTVSGAVSAQFRLPPPPPPPCRLTPRVLHFLRDL